MAGEAAMVQWQGWHDRNFVGGVNSLLIASRQPRQLKAIVSVCSSDDRYAGDVHYMGGCLLNDNLSWASTMFAFNSMPPDPKIVGRNRWRDMWMQQLEGSGLWIDKWMHHQQRDDYWKHGSICEDYNAIRCPVLAVSGWHGKLGSCAIKAVNASAVSNDRHNWHAWKAGSRCR